jgi:hypothetical protein
MRKKLIKELIFINCELKLMRLPNISQNRLFAIKFYFLRFYNELNKNAFILQIKFTTRKPEVNYDLKV